MDYWAPIEKLTKDEVKRQLKRRNLRVGGSKYELQLRLIESAKEADKKAVRLHDLARFSKHLQT